MRAGLLFNRLKNRDDFVTRTNVPIDNEPNSTDVNETTDEVVVVNGNKDSDIEIDSNQLKEQNLVLDEIIVETRDEKKESTQKQILPEPELMNGMDEEHTVFECEEFIDLDNSKQLSIIDESIGSIDSDFDLNIQPISIENGHKEPKISFEGSDESSKDEYEFVVKIPNGQNLDDEVEVKFSTFDKNIGEKLENLLTKFDFNTLSTKKPPLSNDDFERFLGYDEQTTSPPSVNIDCGGDSVRSPFSSSSITISGNNPINNINNTNATRITYDRETILSLNKNHTLIDLKDSRVIRDILRQRLNLFRF